MVRRSTLLSFAAGLAFTAGCRTCNTQANSPQQNSPCQLTGNARPGSVCYDPITGYPVSGGGTIIGPTTVIPSGGYPVTPGVTPRADELPFPTPSDMIPRPGVPYAPPTPAPGDGLGANPKSGAGTPVKLK